MTQDSPQDLNALANMNQSSYYNNDDVIKALNIIGELVVIDQSTIIGGPWPPTQGTGWLCQKYLKNNEKLLKRLGDENFDRLKSAVGTFLTYEIASKNRDTYNADRSKERLNRVLKP